MRRFPLASIAGCALLCACQNGTVTLSVADAPIDGASQVVVRFLGVDLVQNDGSKHSFDFNPAILPNLLTASSNQLLTNVTVPAGDYNKVTLRISADGSVTNSFVSYPTGSPVNAGQTLPLQVLNANGSNVDVPATFHVTRLRNTALTADIDLRRSILYPAVTGDPLVLDFAGSAVSTNVRVVNNPDVGTLTGTVSATLVGSSSNCSPAAVYVYQGNVSTPGDVGGPNPPFASAIVPSGGSGSGLVSYSVAFLPPGIYTAALLCDAVADDPSKNDNLSFHGSPLQNLQVTAGQTTTVTTSFQ